VSQNYISTLLTPFLTHSYSSGLVKLLRAYRYPQVVRTSVVRMLTFEPWYFDCRR
jgi:hypothetical protein